jgi:hypothetical protein
MEERQLKHPSKPMFRTRFDDAIVAADHTP